MTTPPAMPPSPPTTKERILRAALELFARDGYDGVGMQRIAKAIGIKAPSIYKHYKGKRDIFEAILRRMEELDAEAAAACNLPVAPPDKDPAAYARSSAADLVAFARRQFRFWTGDPFASAFRRMLTVAPFRSPRMSALYRAHLGAGPLEYVTALLGSREAALAFYAPMHLLYAVHDSPGGRRTARNLLETHLAAWSRGCAARSTPRGKGGASARPRRKGTPRAG